MSPVHLSSGQWPALRVAMTVILALKEPKPHIFPVSWPQPKPLYCVPLIPINLEWQERRRVLKMAEKCYISYLCAAFWFFLFLSIFRGNNIFDSNFFSTPPACFKESPCQRLHFFHVPVHSKVSFPSVPLLWGLPACNAFFWLGKCSLLLKARGSQSSTFSVKPCLIPSALTEHTLSKKLVNYLSFPGGSDGKGSACNVGGRPGFFPWVEKISWRRKWQPTPVCLPGESHGQRSLVSYSPWGRKESDKTGWLHFHFQLII